MKHIHHLFNIGFVGSGAIAAAYGISRGLFADNITTAWIGGMMTMVCIYEAVTVVYSIPQVKNAIARFENFGKRSKVE